MARSRDIYGRRPTSTSRGKTAQRIMDLQHDPASIPGTETFLADCPEGSLGAGITRFHQSWVVGQPVAPRRAYERTLAMLVHDLAGNGTGVAAPAAELTPERLAQHVHWRVGAHLTDPGELKRLPLHAARLVEHLGGDPIATREAVTAAVANVQAPVAND